MFCKRETFSFISCPKRILINKRWWRLRSTCLCWSVLRVTNLLKDGSVSEPSIESSSLMSIIIVWECQMPLPLPSGLDAPLIPLLSFELPRPHQGPMVAEQETDIYIQAKAVNGYEGPWSTRLAANDNLPFVFFLNIALFGCVNKTVLATVKRFEICLIINFFFKLHINKLSHCPCSWVKTDTSCLSILVPPWPWIRISTSDCFTWK